MIALQSSGVILACRNGHGRSSGDQRRLRLRPRDENPQGQVHIIQWDDLEQETTGLADYTQTLVAQGVAPGEILILTPCWSI
jgi:hypothetical protein